MRTSSSGAVKELIAAHPHLDLVSPYRRIVAGVPHVPDSQLHYHYWSAADEFCRRGQPEMLPEIAASAGEMDAESCDHDALEMLEDCLLQAHHAEPALQLAERALPPLRSQLEAGEIPTTAMMLHCTRLFHLRVGHLLHPGLEGGTSKEAVSAYLSWEMPGILPEFVARTIDFLNDPAPPTRWTREDFALPGGLGADENRARAASKHLHGTLMAVAQDAWQHERIPPGCVFEGLSQVLDSLYGDREREGSKGHDNFLDAFKPKGLEQRITRTCSSWMMFNFAKALHVLEAHEALLQFSRRHALLLDTQISSTAAALARLRTKFTEGWRDREM